MTKTTIAISLDSDVVEEIRGLRINISGEVNEYFKGLINRYNEDVEGINIRLERIKLEKALKKLNHWQGIAKATESKISKWEEVRKEKEEQKLNKEKEEIEKKKKCVNCGAVWGEDYQFHIFSGKNICKPCFLNANSEKIAEWESK